MENNNTDDNNLNNQRMMSTCFALDAIPVCVGLSFFRKEKKKDWSSN
jgi:hypothetical protein